MKIKPMFNAYLVYTDGRVQNKNTGRFLKEDTSGKYYRVTLCNKGTVKRYSVHRLVAMLFIPNPENKPCVNHINGNKLDNNIDNLEWCTYSENEQHSYDVLRKQAPKGEARWNAKFTDTVVKEIILHAKSTNYNQAAKYFGASRSYVRELVLGLKR